MPAKRLLKRGIVREKNRVDGRVQVSRREQTSTEDIRQNILQGTMKELTECSKLKIPNASEDLIIRDEISKALQTIGYAKG